MKKWILGITITVLVIIGFFVNVYIQAVKPLNTARQNAVQEAKDKADLVTTDQFYQYNGKQAYSVVVGKQKNGSKVAVWIPDNLSDNITIMKWADGITKKEALHKLMEKKNPNKILGIRLGMKDEIPVWEISFLDKSKKLNYFYVDFSKTSNHSTLIENI
ncbi:DUF5590 domain-containing protein [Bacillus sp. FJAT-49736]|uniref:cell wall elongation regulator TseB-like domain-containing protein n=1 Tax=Bacillus sp. FJAT-49736 TaxID=2833582 RepID=UPI001BC9A2DB|nr:DUF5590 domain-containing protein [Bacillus sp. FJAT-49736]MBS4173245.1 DUF5590 domain-containing protein [Bacillus sp. FJAT-49736]